MHYIDRIESMEACDDATEWLRTEDHPDLAAAWAACPRGDWMLWLAGRCAAAGSPEHRVVVAAAADCAAAALDLIPAGEGRPRAAVETARRWAAQAATAAECWAAANASANASANATTANAAWAANAAANAAWAGAAAANAAAHAAWAAWAANAAADAAAGAHAAARIDRSADFAGIVRRHLPHPPTIPE